MVELFNKALLRGGLVIGLSFALSGCLHTIRDCSSEDLQLACESIAATGAADVIITLKAIGEGQSGDRSAAIAAFKATFDPADVTFLSELSSVMVLTAQTNRAGLRALVDHPAVEHVMSDGTKLTSD